MKHIFIEGKLIIQKKGSFQIVILFSTVKNLPIPTSAYYPLNPITMPTVVDKTTINHWQLLSFTSHLLIVGFWGCFKLSYWAISTAPDLFFIFFHKKMIRCDENLFVWPFGGMFPDSLLSAHMTKTSHQQSLGLQSPVCQWKCTLGVRVRNRSLTHWNLEAFVVKHF